MWPWASHLITYFPFYDTLWYPGVRLAGKNNAVTNLDAQGQKGWEKVGATGENVRPNCTANFWKAGTGSVYFINHYVSIQYSMGHMEGPA